MAGASEQTFSSLDLHRLENLRIGTTHEDKEDERTSLPGVSTTDDASGKTCRFLDLPFELRSNIYELLRPSACKSLEKKAVFVPPFFWEGSVPESICLSIKIRSCRENDYEGPHCNDVHCGENAKDFLKLTRVSRKIRDEVNRILYARFRVFDGNYQFQTAVHHLSYAGYNISTPLCILNKLDMLATWRLGCHGIPFAVMEKKERLRGIDNYSSELLVPDWVDGGVSWRRLSDVEWTWGPSSKDQVNALLFRMREWTKKQSFSKGLKWLK